MPLAVLRAKDFEHAPRFQLWTDALCFREMAKEAPNNYLRSMSVRNAVLSAWTTLEMACCDALGIEKLKYDFKQSLDDEFDKKSIPRLDFGSGIWGEINSTVKGYRKLYSHFGVNLAERFPPVSIAENAIKKIREAIQDIYGVLSKSYPKWVELDEVESWPQRPGGLTVTAAPVHVRFLHPGAHPDSPDVISIVLKTEQGEEKANRYLPPETSDEEMFYWVEDTIGKLPHRVTAIRVYRGADLVHEEELEAR
jgi:hypothetical protein